MHFGQSNLQLLSYHIRFAKTNVSAIKGSKVWQEFLVKNSAENVLKDLSFYQVFWLIASLTLRIKIPHNCEKV